MTAKRDVPWATCWVTERREGDVMRGIMMKPPPIPASDPASPAMVPMPKDRRLWFLMGGGMGDSPGLLAVELADEESLVDLKRRGRMRWHLCTCRSLFEFNIVCSIDLMLQNSKMNAKTSSIVFFNKTASEGGCHQGRAAEQNNLLLYHHESQQIMMGHL